MLLSLRTAALAALALATTPVAFAQSTLPKYDLAAETKMKGTVQELKLPEKGHEKDSVRLTLKSGTDTLEVYVCPKSFWDDMGANVAKGDEVIYGRYAGNDITVDRKDNIRSVPIDAVAVG